MCVRYEVVNRCTYYNLLSGNINFKCIVICELWLFRVTHAMPMVVSSDLPDSGGSQSVGHAITVGPGGFALGFESAAG